MFYGALKTVPTVFRIDKEETVHMRNERDIKKYIDEQISEIKNKVGNKKAHTFLYTLLVIKLYG